MLSGDLIKGLQIFYFNCDRVNFHIKKGKFMMSASEKQIKIDMSIQIKNRYDLLMKHFLILQKRKSFQKFQHEEDIYSKVNMVYHDFGEINKEIKRIGGFDKLNLLANIRTELLENTSIAMIIESLADHLSNIENDIREIQRMLQHYKSLVGYRPSPRW